MIKLKDRLSFIIISLLFCFYSFVSFFTPLNVSAVSSFEWPTMPYVSNVPQNFNFSDALDSLSNNSSLSNIDLDSCRVFFKYNVNPQMYDIFVVPTDQIVDSECKTFFYYERTYSMVKFMSGYKTYCTYNAFSSTTFYPFTQVDNTTFGSVDTWGCVHITDGFNSVPYLVVPFYVDVNRGGAYNSAELTGNLGTAFGNFSVPFTPDFSGPLIGFPVGLEFSVQDFMQWLIDNDKISVSVDSGGVSVGGQIPAYIGVSKLRSFLEFYKQFGSSNSSFISRIGAWFAYMNIATQTNDNIVILKNTIDSLYREYINSFKVEIYPSSVEHAHHRRNVNTQTTDDDLTLVTDDSNDDIYTTLLREIIRGVVALQSSFISGCNAIIDTLNNLDFSVNVSNNGGTGFDYNAIWGTGDITQSENYLSLTNAFMDKGVDVSAAENMKINYLDNASQQDSFTVSVVMPDQFVNGQFTEKIVTHTIDNSSKMYNTLILFRKLIAFVVIAYFAIRIRFELPHLIRGE